MSVPITINPPCDTHNEINEENKQDTPVPVHVTINPVGGPVHDTTVLDAHPKLHEFEAKVGKAWFNFSSLTPSDRQYLLSAIWTHIGALAMTIPLIAASPYDYQSYVSFAIALSGVYKALVDLKTKAEIAGEDEKAAEIKEANACKV